MCSSREDGKMRRIISKVNGGYRAACTKLSICGMQNSKQILLALGLVLIAGGIMDFSMAQGSPSGPSGSYTEANFDDELIRNGVGNLFQLIEGAFGALIMVVAGLGAIIAAAMGAYRAALGMLVVALGAFILRALVSLFFGGGYQSFSSGGAN